MTGWIVEFPKSYRDVLGAWTTQVWFLFLAANMLIGGFCLNYSSEFFLAHLTGQHVQVPFWPCALAGGLFGRLALAGITAAWFLSLFQ